MEQIKDIVAEMRGYAADMAERFKNAVKGDRHLDCNVISFRIGEFAHRIAAAHNREVADALNTGAFVAEAKAVTDCNHLNGAKIREALLEVKRVLKYLYKPEIAPMDGDNRHILKAEAILEAALAALPTPHEEEGAE